MNPRQRLWLIGALGAGLGLVLAFGIAQEAYAVAGLLTAAIAWLSLEWAGGPRPEAWVLAAAIFGYVVGNRGFAQFSPTRSLPLLPAEVALLVGTAATLLRMARRQTAAVLPDPLNFAIVAWMLLGTARLWPDVRNHGAVALRDFATIYYATFFFIAQSLARHPASSRILRGALLAGVSTLPVSYFLFQRFPGIFLGTLQVHGAPLFYYKDDLVAAYFFAGVFLLMTTGWPILLRGGLAVAGYASAFSIASSRAAIVGLVVTGGWWAVARRWAPWKLQALIVPLALGFLCVQALVQDADFEQSRLYMLYDRVRSITDFSGTRRYATEDRNYMADNNRFRLAWWQAVADEVREGNPVFGLGFGYDLTERFVQSYDFDLGDEFSVRSPHSIVFTVLGRMGLAGLAALVAVVAAMATATWRLARRARTDDDALVPLGWWSVSWVMFISGCFGVVLEGPMGAVIFWTALGMANATSTALTAATTSPVTAAADLRSPAAVDEVAARP